MTQYQAVAATSPGILLTHRQLKPTHIRRIDTPSNAALPDPIQDLIHISAGQVELLLNGGLGQGRRHCSGVIAPKRHVQQCEESFNQGSPLALTAIRDSKRYSPIVGERAKYSLDIGCVGFNVWNQHQHFGRIQIRLSIKLIQQAIM